MSDKSTAVQNKNKQLSNYTSTNYQSNQKSDI